MELVFFGILGLVIVACSDDEPPTAANAAETGNSNEHPKHRPHRGGQSRDGGGRDASRPDSQPDPAELTEPATEPPKSGAESK